jgi:hypothetical protein
VIGRPASPPVSLGHRVDHAEQYPGGGRRVDVGADITIPLGFLHEVSDNVIELPPAIQRVSLGGGIAAGSQQERNVRRPIGQHDYTLPDQVFQPVDCRLDAGRYALRYGKKPVECPVKSQAQQLLLAIHVMVNRRLRYAEAKRQVLHAGAAITALVKHGPREPQEVELLSGRLDAARLRRLLPVTCDVAAVDHWWLCGPYGMVTGARAVLAELGVPPERVHRELFHVEDEPRRRSGMPTPAGRERRAMAAARPVRLP